MTLRQHLTAIQEAAHQTQGVHGPKTEEALLRYCAYVTQHADAALELLGSSARVDYGPLADALECFRLVPDPDVAGGV